MRKHDRQYDLVVFGATGYTGQFTAEYVAGHLPTDLKWAVAGRSASKLEELVATLKKLSPDRRQPAVEVCDLNESRVTALVKKSYIFITTVGPYGSYGELAFRACAENGTHYLDVTGEVPFVARMIGKYEEAAKSSGSRMFPQIGLESAPADLVTFSLAQMIRSEFAADSRDVIVSLCELSSAPSGGTLATVLAYGDNYSLAEVRASYRSFALSPVSHPKPTPRTSLLTRFTGLRNVPNLGLNTTWFANKTDAAIVGRTWGLFSVIPSRREQFYGPNFSFTEYKKTRNWLTGLLTHYSVALLGLLLMGIRPLRTVVKRFIHAPGQGPAREKAAKSRIEYRGVANPDLDSVQGKQAYCRAWYSGTAYQLTAVLLGEAALTILEDDIELDGGIYTPACLGQRFIDRLDNAGFEFETSVIPV